MQASARNFDACGELNPFVPVGANVRLTDLVGRGGVGGNNRFRTGMTSIQRRASIKLAGAGKGSRTSVRDAQGRQHSEHDGTETSTPASAVEAGTFPAPRRRSVLARKLTKMLVRREPQDTGKGCEV
jgi:hypothetical protein